MSAAAPAPKANMGQPIPRVDGQLKVTGAARYPGDLPVENATYAVLVTSPVAVGRISNIDVTAAQAMPGVLSILTHENAGNEIKKTETFPKGPASQSVVPLASDKIWYAGQIVAVLVAETFETASDAASRVRITYDREPPASGFDADGATTVSVKSAQPSHEDPKVGDAEAALASAEFKVDAQFGTPTQHHNPIELFTTTCSWNGDDLVVYEPSQFVYGLKHGVAEQLGIDPARVRVVSTYIGGAFGSKGSVTPRTALVALAARRVGRPVKLVPTRAQGFTVSTYRAETRHHVRLGAGRDGKLVALSHEGWEVTSRPDPYNVSGTDATSRLYACPNVWTATNIVHADRSTPGFMRSPPEVPYVYALESAMDELAEKLGMDPVELRRINDTMTEPIKGLPYTSRSVMACFDQASEAFSWKQRSPKPGTMRDGDWLIGFGCAMATYPSQIAPATVRIHIDQDAHVRVETAAHDVGTGAYTVIGQAVAERLGVAPETVTVMLGDTLLPPAPVAGGSNTTASVVNAATKACDAILTRLSEGKMAIGTFDLAAALKSSPQGAIEQYSEWIPDGLPPDAVKKLYSGKAAITGGTHLKDRVQFAFGAEFVEVRVHRLTREIRVPRIVGAFAASRILNTRTARSQLMGGLIWGIGSALHEATEIDSTAARYVNDNLADYLIAVNADIRQLDVILVPETDDKVNPAGIKGLGELANVGTAAAVANAVYHATGVRVRDLPIRIEKLLA